MDLLTEKRSKIFETLINNGFAPPLIILKELKGKTMKIVEITGDKVG
jgi:hypothetical protein